MRMGGKQAPMKISTRCAAVIALQDGLMTGDDEVSFDLQSTPACYSKRDGSRGRGKDVCACVMRTCWPCWMRCADAPCCVRSHR